MGTGVRLRLQGWADSPQQQPEMDGVSGFTVSAGMVQQQVSHSERPNELPIPARERAITKANMRIKVFNAQLPKIEPNTSYSITSYSTRPKTVPKGERVQKVSEFSKYSY